MPHSAHHVTKRCNNIINLIYSAIWQYRPTLPESSSLIGKTSLVGRSYR